MSVTPDRSEGGARRGHWAKSERLWPLLALSLLVLGSTGHRFLNGFVFDDVSVIEDGTVVHDRREFLEIFLHRTMYASIAGDGPVQSVDTYRPIPIALFMWDSMLSGRQPWAYHLTNLLLHIGNTWLLYFLGISLLGGKARWPVLYGAALFSLHPWGVEAHVWINGRSDPLALLFGLVSLLCLIRSERLPAISSGRSTSSEPPRTNAWLWRMFSALAFFLGLLSKEVLLLWAPLFVLMPALVAGRIAIRSIQEALVRRSLRALALGLAVVAYLIVRVQVLGGMQTHVDGRQFSKAMSNLPVLWLDALSQAVWPRQLCLRSLAEEYSAILLWQRVIAVLLIAIIIGSSLWFWRRWSERALGLLPFCVLLFLAPLIPVAMITTMQWPGFGRYLYLPLASMGLATMVLGRELVRRTTIRPAILKAGAILLLLLYGAGTAMHCLDYRSEERLYNAVSYYHPELGAGPGSLGLSYARRDMHELAIPLLLTAFERNPRGHQYLVQAGHSAIALGARPLVRTIAEDGMRQFRGTPNEAPFRLIAVGGLDASEPEQAINHLLFCLELYPHYPGCVMTLSQLLADPERREAHRRILERALRAHPSLAHEFELSPGRSAQP